MLQRISGNLTDKKGELLWILFFSDIIFSPLNYMNERGVGIVAAAFEQGT